MTDLNSRLAAIELRSKMAARAWKYGNVGLLRTMTLDDVPWMLETLRHLSRTVEVFAERDEHGRTVRDDMTADEIKRWREKDDYIAAIADARLASSLALPRGAERDLHNP